MATLRLSFHHDRKISPAWWRGGGTRRPLSLYLPSRTKLWCTLQLKRQIYFPYFYSTPFLYSVFVHDYFFGRKGDIWKPPPRPFQLSSTLNPRQAAACDGRRLHMRCPEGTKVSHAKESSTSFQECWHTDSMLYYTMLGRIGDYSNYSTYSTTNLSIDIVGNRLLNGRKNLSCRLQVGYQ
jgi:hypothetical protein